MAKDLNRHFSKENIQVTKKHMERYLTLLIIRQANQNQNNYHVIYHSYFWVYTKKNSKTGSQRDICTPMFIAALFTVIKR